MVECDAEHLGMFANEILQSISQNVNNNISSFSYNILLIVF